jgi:hypothetical protein
MHAAADKCAAQLTGCSCLCAAHSGEACAMRVLNSWSTEGISARTRECSVLAVAAAAWQQHVSSLCCKLAVLRARCAADILWLW